MKQLISSIVGSVRKRARRRRARIFLDSFELRPETKILDVGSENGSNIAALLHGASVTPKNVHIADISEDAVRRGHESFGFVPVVIPESGRLPFDDGFFDVVYCSSVIEHVTVPKSEIWSVRDGSLFRAQARIRQKEFAREIARLGRGYFVQTPCRSFPVESHTWLPFVGYLPRRILVPLLKFTNRWWVKKTNPDWNLLTEPEMQLLFPGAQIVREKFLGLTKSIMAIKR